MVVIPRYEGTLSSAPINSGRRLTTGLSGANSLINFGQQLSNDLNTYATQKIEIVAKQRDQEILNRSLLADAEAETINSNFVDNYLPQIKDYNEYNTEYDRYWSTRESAIKKKHFTKNGAFDEIAWKRYQPTYWKTYAEGKVNVNKAETVARNAQTLNVYNEFIDKTVDKVNNINNIAGLQSIQKEVEKRFVDFKKINTFSDKGIASSRELLDDTMNNRFMILQTSDNQKEPTYINPDGISTIDYAQIVNNLSDTSKTTNDLNGKEIILNDPRRQKLINDYRILASNQKTFDDNRKAKLALEEENAIFAQHAEYTKKNKDLTPLEYLALEALINSSPNINEKVKETIKSSLKRELTDSAGNKITVDKARGKENFNKMKMFIGTGIYDTEAEINAIRMLGMNGYFGEEDYQVGLVDYAAEKLDTINESKKKDLLHASKIVGQSIGIQGISNMNTGNLEGAMDVLELFVMTKAIKDNAEKINMNSVQLAILNELQYQVSEGEKKGISYNDMLRNPNSKYYLIDEIVKSYAVEIDNEIKRIAGEIVYDGLYKEGQAVNMVDNAFTTTAIGDSFTMTVNRRILGDDYFLGISPTQNTNVVLANQNESIDDYFARINQMTDSPEEAITPTVILGADAIFADGLKTTTGD